MSTPKRIQRKREKGWVMPDGAVYVGRPTRWGNRYRTAVDVDRDVMEVIDTYDNTTVALYRDRAMAHKTAVDFFREYVESKPELAEAIREQLAGKDLVCWCPLDAPCHADVLLEVANPGWTPPQTGKKPRKRGARGRKEAST